MTLMIGHWLGSSQCMKSRIVFPAPLCQHKARRRGDKVEPADMDLNNLIQIVRHCVLNSMLALIILSMHGNILLGGVMDYMG